MFGIVWYSKPMAYGTGDLLLEAVGSGFDMAIYTIRRHGPGSQEVPNKKSK